MSSVSNVQMLEVSSQHSCCQKECHLGSNHVSWKKEAKFSEKERTNDFCSFDDGVNGSKSDQTMLSGDQPGNFESCLHFKMKVFLIMRVTRTDDMDNDDDDDNDDTDDDTDDVNDDLNCSNLWCRGRW